MIVSEVSKFSLHIGEFFFKMKLHSEQDQSL